MAVQGNTRIALETNGITGGRSSGTEPGRAVRPGFGQAAGLVPSRRRAGPNLHRVVPRSWERRARRVLDLIISATALLAGAPFALAFIVLARLTSRAPVFFAQSRVGLHGRIFTMYKFRTLPPKPAYVTDRLWSGTAPWEAGLLARLARRLGVDEWPQFWNVVRGEMSVVGPRPERPHFASRFQNQMPAYRRREQVKPGITGWAQIHALRGDSDVAARLEYDLAYIENQSLLLDMKVLLLTPVSVLSRLWQREAIPVGGSGTFVSPALRYREREDCGHA